MRTTIKKFAEGEGVSIRFLYKEAASGRLVMTKVGSRTFIDDEDAAKWRALALKVTGKADNMALRVAVQKIEELGRAVGQGRIARQFAVSRLFEVVRKVG